MQKCECTECKHLPASDFEVTSAAGLCICIAPLLLTLCRAGVCGGEVVAVKVLMYDKVHQAQVEDEVRAIINTSSED